jgi:hypothetical protein
METILELKKIKQSILCNPLTPIIKNFNSHQLISNDEYYLKIEEINKKIKKEIKEYELQKKNSKSISKTDIQNVRNPKMYMFNIKQKPELKTVKERPFHHLKMLFKSLDKDLINENSFNEFIEEELLRGKTIEEQEQNLETARNLLNTLAMYSEYITPIIEDISEHRELANNKNSPYEGVFWTTTNTASILEVQRKTIYNWLDDEDFRAKKGKLDIEKLANYLKRKNPKYLDRLQQYLN